MKQLLSAICALIVTASAFAVDVKDAPPPETANVIGIALFVIVFVGLCVGFFAYMWWKQKKEDEKQ